MPEDSHILAVDKSKQHLKSVMGNHVAIGFRVADFETADLHCANLHGILMANSLHYVKEKKALIRRLAHYLSPGGIFLIVEYDTLKANPWVPYPIDLLGLKALFTEMGYTTIQKLAEQRSLFGQGNLYAAKIG